MARAAKYITLLGLYLAAVAAAAGFVAARRYGSDAYLASAIAALVVWVSGSSALALLASAPSPTARLNAALGAMMLRMALPLVALLFFFQTQHPLLAAGVAGLIAVHYLAGLIVETLLSVRIVASGPKGAPPASPA